MQWGHTDSFVNLGMFSGIIAPVILVLALSAPLHAAETGAVKRVLILFSEDKTHPAHQMTEQGIREAFRASRRFDIQVYTEYIDLSRFASDSHARAMAGYLHQKYAPMKMDVLIAVYPAALDFVLANRRTLFPGIPIVAAEISRSQAGVLGNTPLRRSLTGTIMGDNLTGVIEAAIRMKPKTKHIALIAGTTPNDLYAIQLYRSALKPYMGRFALIDLTKLTMKETLSRVESLPQDTLIFYAAILKDGAGKAFVPREVLSSISQASKVPVFGLYDTYLGYGIVGGRLASMHKQGHEAGAMALRIMAGASPASIPFGGDRAYMDAYDWRELKRWDIPVEIIPAGAEIRYYTPTVWERYRLVIVGAVSLIIGETLLILGLLLNYFKRRHAEETLRQHDQELMLLTGRLIHAQEEELRRLSRDLHDDLTQRLAVLAIDAGMLEKSLRDRQPQAAQGLAALKAQLIEASDEVHGLARRLHPSILDDLGLVQAVRSECESFARRTGIAVSFESGNHCASVPHGTALCLYRILQEALQNIAKHAQTLEARVVLEDGPEGLYLRIYDAGIGFDLKQAAGKGTIGLSSMRERARLVDGTLSIVSGPGKGTMIQIFAPMGGEHVQSARTDRRGSQDRR